MTERGIKLRIECHHLVGNRARLWIDDEEVTGNVARVEAVWDAGRVNHVTVTYLVREMEIETEALATEEGLGHLDYHIEVGAGRDRSDRETR